MKKYGCPECKKHIPKLVMGFAGYIGWWDLYNRGMFHTKTTCDKCGHEFTEPGEVE